MAHSPLSTDLIAWRRNPHPTDVPEILLSKAWAYGLLEQRLILSFLHLVPLNGALADATRLRDFVQVVFEVSQALTQPHTDSNTNNLHLSQLELTGIRRPQARRVTRRVFLPVVSVLLALLLAPALFIGVLTEVFGLGAGKELHWLRRVQRMVVWVFL